VFINRELRRIFVKRNEVTGELRKTHNEKLNFTGDKIEKNGMGVACSAYEGGEKRVHGFGGET
jgi:hypothetical protein